MKVDIEGAEIDLFLKADNETLLSVRQFTIEFHDFWYPELRDGTEQVKDRMRELGLWTMRGTPNNKDVLFVHPDHQGSGWQRLVVGAGLRNLNGAGRALNLGLRKIAGKG